MPRLLPLVITTPALLVVCPALLVAAQPSSEGPTVTAPQRPPAAGGTSGAAPARTNALDAPQTAHPGFVRQNRTTKVDDTFRSTRAGSPGNTEQLRLVDPGLFPSDGSNDVPEFHVVQEGDTLWDISEQYFADPYAWPMVWSWNEQLTNPHWVFPGDRVRLWDPQLRAGPAQPRLRFSKTRIPQRVGLGSYMLNQVAFVDARQFKTSMKVIGGGEAKVMMATLDTVYMKYDKSNPPIPGERLVVYAPADEVKDIDNKKVVGYVVQVMGEVEVDSLATKAAEGTVASAVNPIERGYRVGPLRRRFRRIDPIPAERSASGLVIATLMSTGPIPIPTPRRQPLQGDHVLAGEEQFVIVNLGRNDGVKTGNLLEVVRKGDEYTQKRVFKIPYEDGWPRRVIGALLVVEVQDDTALAVAVYARREFERGDHVELRGPGLSNATDGSQAGPAAAGTQLQVERNGTNVRGRGSFTLGGQ